MELSQHPVLVEAEALGDSAAAMVLGGGENLDPIELPGRQRVIDEKPHCGGHDPSALMRLVQP
jgi:hypothetical protein